jgi:hypothetical protein
VKNHEQQIRKACNSTGGYCAVRWIRIVGRWKPNLSARRGVGSGLKLEQAYPVLHAQVFDAQARNYKPVLHQRKIKCPIAGTKIAVFCLIFAERAMKTRKGRAISNLASEKLAR